MISLKRFLDSNQDVVQQELLAAIVRAYQSALNLTGASAAQACPSVEPELRRRLTSLGQQLTDVGDPAVVTGTEALVSQELIQWGALAEANLQQKTKDVKELLIVLAQTAATMATTDDRHARRFESFTARLEGIAKLEDLSQLRTSIVRSAVELRNCVHEISASARASVSQLQAQVVTYQTKLEAAEQLATRDSLTGLFNRGKMESVIEHRMALARPFCVALIDLDGFKAVNDRFGHAAGDDLLKQFSADLKANARPSDHVGRWGGDEFIIVLDCGQKDAAAHIERIEKWVVGDYTIESSTGREKVRLDASIGLSEWSAGLTTRDLIERADVLMYSQKRTRR